MRQLIRHAMFIGFAASAAVISGCGGSSGSSQGTTTQPFSGQYQAVFTQSSVNGKVSVDNTGGATLALHTSGANPSLALNFCNFGRANGCASIGPLTGDAAGNINTNFKIAEHGAVAGFFIGTLNGTDVISAGFLVPNRTDIFTAVLLPAGSLSQGIGSWSPTPGGGTDTGNGTVAVASGASTAHIELNGAPANTTYIAEFCGGDAFDPSNCRQLGQLLTNASGSGTFEGSVSFEGIGGSGGEFVLIRQLTPGVPASALLEFVSGFRLP
jgi:hypothetical protein